jgi:hypothetical protein
VTLEQLLACRADVLGSGERTAPAPEPVPLATLDEVLAYGRDSGATLNVEIKNIPNEPDFDPSRAYADRVMDTIVESRLPTDRLIVQSFWPANLDVARERLPGVQLSLLTLGPTNNGAPEYAQANGYHWISPQWPVGRDVVERAHGHGLKVVPYTLNEPADVQLAAEYGVDALITDDPVMARRALGRPDPPPPADEPPQGGTTPGGGQAQTGGTTQTTTPTRPARRTDVRLRRVPRRLGTVLRTGWLPIRVVTTRRAMLQLRVLVRGRRRAIARRVVYIPGAGARRVGLHLSRAGRRLLRSRRRITLRVRGLAATTAGNAQRVRLVVRLRR